LGNLYASQFFAGAKQDLPGLESNFRSGDFTTLKTWLNENIHHHGKRYSADALCERVTGKPLSHRPMMEYLRAKFGPLYDV
jgi:carboxypeptidase Taq